MKLPKFKKTTESEKMLNKIESEHKFLDNAKKFPLPNRDEIDFDIEKLNTYWVQKENLWTKKQKKQSTKEHTIENIRYLDQNISSENTNRYMWKIMKDCFINKEREYSPEFIVWSLQYLFTKIPYWKVNFVIWPIVSELMNGQRDVSNAMSEEEQIAFIQYLVCQYFPDRINDLNIVPIQDKHRDLFLAMGMQEDRDKTKEKNDDKLQEVKQKELELNDPLKALETEELPTLDSKNISSLHIAQHLYAVCKSNKKFDEAIRRIAPPNLWEKTESSYYYGLIEISIRLVDYLNWITIQGWKSLQGKYDQFIKTITMGNCSDLWRGELDNLSEFCQEILKDKKQKFATIHLNTNKYKDRIREQESIERTKKDKINRKNNLKKNIAITALSLSLLFWFGYRAYDSATKLSKAKKEQKINLENEKRLADKTLWYSLTNYSNFDEHKDKIHVLNTGASNVYNIITKRYIEDFDESEKEELISMIKDELIRSDQINDVNVIEYLNWNANSFIKNYLIPNHTNQLMRLWFETIPYRRLQEDSPSMYNTLLQKDDIIYKKDRHSKLPQQYQKVDNWKYQLRNLQELWDYQTDWWGSYKIWYIYQTSPSSYVAPWWIAETMKEIKTKQSWEYIPWNIYFLASKDGKIYTKALWEEVIMKRLAEWYPLLDDIIRFMWEDKIDKNKVSAEFIKWIRKWIHNDINLSKQEKINQFLEFYEGQK